MLFKLTNKNSDRMTHCGVLEFVADEGICYLPHWVSCLVLDCQNLKSRISELPSLILRRWSISWQCLSLLVMFLQQPSVLAQASLCRSLTKQSRMLLSAPDSSWNWIYTTTDRHRREIWKHQTHWEGFLCLFPFLHMMQNLLLEEGGLVQVESVNLQVATYSKFQPQSPDFLDITNPKAVYPSYSIME